MNKYWEETGRNTLTCGNRGPVTGRQRQKANLAKEDVVAQVCADQAPKASRSLLFLVTEGPFSSHGHVEPSQEEGWEGEPQETILSYHF